MATPDIIENRIASVEFVYRPFFGSIGRSRRKTHKVIFSGIAGDHIFEQVRQASCFYERDLLECIDLTLSRPANLIVDVGANIGNHTLFFSKIVGAKVISVEPNPIAIELLRLNMSQNGVGEEVTIVEAAAANQPGILHLHIGPPSNLGETKVGESKDIESVHVVALTLDEILASRARNRDDRVSLIKIDVEGFENQVLLGALKTLIEHRPVVVVESEIEDSCASVNELLCRLGYHRFGPFCATPTYIFCQSRLTVGSGVLFLKLRQLLRAAKGYFSGTVKLSLSNTPAADPIL
jgi:FkbM family methyltransferase